MIQSYTVFGYWAQKLLTKELQGLDSVFLFQYSCGHPADKSKQEGRKDILTLWLRNKSDCSRSLFAVSAFPPFPNLRDFLPFVKKKMLAYVLLWKSIYRAGGSHDLSANFKNWFCLLRNWHIVNSLLVVLSGILKFWRAAGRGRRGASKLNPLRSKDKLPTPCHFTNIPST